MNTLIIVSMLGSGVERDQTRQAMFVIGAFWSITVLVPVVVANRRRAWSSEHGENSIPSERCVRPVLAFVALNDLRVCAPELLELGMRLPGLRDRVQVLQRLPNLALLTLGALTPERWDVRYIEGNAEDLVAQPPEADLVAIAAYTASIDDAYRLSAACRDGGSKVVLGGLHVTSCPKEAVLHCDSIVAGEAEHIWPRLVDDFEANHMQARYLESNSDGCLTGAPPPRLDLLPRPDITRFTLQTQRGCPHRCEFCAASPIYGGRFRTKPLPHVRRELEQMAQLVDHPYVELADDNTFADRRYGKALCRLLAEHGARWFTETDISIADDDELLRLMGESGCREVLVGLESVLESSLDGIDESNWKRRRGQGYREAIDCIQAHGVAVNGCFILGLDGDDAGVFERLVEFVDASGLADVQVTVLTPFPNTPLYHRLRLQRRLLRERFWEQCTLLDVTYRPQEMTVEQLQTGFRWTIQELYNSTAYRQRRRRFLRG